MNNQENLPGTKGLHMVRLHITAWPMRARSYAGILGALILRDVRSRMMGSAWNYVRVIGMPLFHLLSIAIFYSLMGRAALLGTDKIVYYASGILPFMLFLYPVRSNILAIDDNRPLLVFPRINPIDLVISRALLEIINSLVVITILAVALFAFGADVIPKDPFKTLTGIAMTMLFSLSFCLPNAILSRLVSNWLQACVLTAVGLYISSGALFLPSQMPPVVSEIIYFNPLAHCVEWVRSGYYETYHEGLLDKRYLLSVILVLFVAGLGMERFLRGKLN